jgi:TRAP-type C4-dicarboxylate transport system permease small subunit
MRRLLSATETVAAVFLLLIALLTAGNVLLRDLFSVQVPDWFDGSRMLQGIALFWGFALATCYGSHICVDVVWEHLSVPRRRMMDIVATALSLLFLAPLAWMAWVKVAGTGTQGTMDLRLPLKWFFAVAALGATLAAVLCVVRLLRLVQRREDELRPATVAEIEAGHP